MGSSDEAPGYLEELGKSQLNPPEELNSEPETPPSEPEFPEPPSELPAPEPETLPPELQPPVEPEQPAVQDDVCEADADLKKVCYFRKALEERDSSYCSNLGEMNDCIFNVAAILRNESQCLGDAECIQIVSECINNAASSSYCRVLDDFRCSSVDPKKAAACISKFGM